MTEKKQNSETRFAVCINNDGYPASLELRKIYQVIPDARAAEANQIRVIDESGEDYGYPAGLFAPIELPQAIEQAVSLPA